MYNTNFTDKHKKIFSKPQTMQQITDLFKGDIYQANAFQSVNLIGRNLKTIIIDEKLYFVNYNYNESKN